MSNASEYKNRLLQYVSTFLLLNDTRKDSNNIVGTLIIYSLGDLYILVGRFGGAGDNWLAGRCYCAWKRGTGKSLFYKTGRAEREGRPALGR